MSKRLLPLGALVLSFLGAGPTRAATIVVQNSSFETPPVDAGTFASLTAPPWVLTGTGTLFEGALPVGAGVFTNQPNPGGAPPASGPYSNGHLEGADGGQVAFVFSNAGNSITQALVDPTSTLVTNFVAGNSYTLTTAVALATTAPKSTDRLAIQLYYTDTGGTHVVAQRILTPGGTTPTLSQQTLQDYSLSTGVLAANDAAVGKQINIGYFALDNGPESIEFPPVASDGEFDIDNVRLVSSVPEPTSLALVGVAGMLTLRRRRRS